MASNSNTVVSVVVLVPPPAVAAVANVLEEPVWNTTPLNPVPATEDVIDKTPLPSSVASITELITVSILVSNKPAYAVEVEPVAKKYKGA